MTFKIEELGSKAKSFSLDELQNKDLVGKDLSNQNLSGLDISGANLTGANLKNAKLLKTNLSGAILTNANLSFADLSGANLKGANLDNIKADRASFGLADLTRASLFNGELEFSTFIKAKLINTNLSCANLQGCRFREANLTGANFFEASLISSDLSMTTVDKANFNNADLRGARLRLIKGFKKASWIGSDIRDINFSGAYMLRRFIIDENYIKEFKEHNKLTRFLYYLWLITSNCGRSMFRWFCCSIILVFLFAWLYNFVGIDYGPHPTPLSNIYFSVVTMTTLGFGDVIPSSAAGQLLVMLEVITGYIMLGGLLSIFSNKMARRGE